MHTFYSHYSIRYQLTNSLFFRNNKIRHINIPSLSTGFKLFNPINTYNFTYKQLKDCSYSFCKAIYADLKSCNRYCVELKRLNCDAVICQYSFNKSEFSFKGFYNNIVLKYCSIISEKELSLIVSICISECHLKDLSKSFLQVAEERRKCLKGSYKRGLNKKTPETFTEKKRLSMKESIDLIEKKRQQRGRKRYNRYLARSRKQNKKKI